MQEGIGYIHYVHGIDIVDRTHDQISLFFTLVPHIDFPPYPLMTEMMSKVTEYRNTALTTHASALWRRKGGCQKDHSRSPAVIQETISIGSHSLHIFFTSSNGEPTRSQLTPSGLAL